MDWLFIIFAVVTLVPALLTATSRNPVNAAMSMILSFVGMAALMVLLETYFLAILQILVYAGAIVVLFLFIIMLIDAEKAPGPGKVRSAAAIVAFFLLTGGIFALFLGPQAMPAPALQEATMNSAQVFGVELFTSYMLPFQVAGFMLLIAMVGVIVLSKKPTEAETGVPS
ncbi:MAG: NADH-quinone oxidoreductase subunit J [Opitutales bacterium]